MTDMPHDDRLAKATDGGRIGTVRSGLGLRLGRVGGRATRYLVSIRRHRSQLAAAAIVLISLIAFGGLNWSAALLGWLALVVLAAIRPIRHDRFFGAADGIAGTVLATVEPARIDWPAVLASLPQPAMLLSRSAVVLHENAAARELIGESRSNQHVSALIRNPDFLEAVARIVSAQPAQPQVVRYWERVPVERHIEAAIGWLAPRPSDAESPAMLVSFADLTERERLERMRTDFVANASHELRTPLASLSGYIETLQGPAGSDAATRVRFLGIMADQAGRMRRLLDDLMSLARVEMRAHMLPRGLVDLVDVTRSVVEALEPLAREAGMTVVLEPFEGKAMARGDRDELVQVFQNLLHNALKYGREGGKVSIRIDPCAKDPQGRLAVSVMDDGPGIAPEHLPRLTERFYRVDPAASRAKGGTGLGLAIVKHVVARHRGELAIRSELGKGSTFTVLLPAYHPS